MPTIVIQPGLGDTYLDLDNPTTNYGSSTLLSTGNSTDTTGYQRSLVKFDLSTIPSGAYIFSATFSLYYDGAGQPNSLPLPVYTVLEDWNELQATWVDRLTGTLWVTAGAAKVSYDYRSPSLDTKVVNFGTPGWTDWNITAQVQNWIYGEANYGMLLAQFDTGAFNNNLKSFYSSNYVIDLLKRPKLTVNYAIPPDVPVMTPLTLYTKGNSCTVSWTDESGTGAVEYYPQMSSMTNFSSNVTTLSGLAKQEEIMPGSTTTVNTEWCVLAVEGVWTNPNKTGTNYHTGGSSVRNSITLGTSLPSSTTIVYVFYTTNGWTPRTQVTFSEFAHGQQVFFRVRSRNTINAASAWSTPVGTRMHDEVDTLELIQPNGYEVWNGGFTKVIEWIAQDLVSVLQDQTEISYSRDSGQTWITIATGLANTYSIIDEQTTSETSNRVYTRYQIQKVTGVWLASDPGHTGTNYYTGGSFDMQEIVLGTNLSSENESVLIDYTSHGKYNWLVPTNLDTTTGRIKIKVIDVVGNIKETISDKDFTIITIKNRLHESVYDTSNSSRVSKLMKTYSHEEQLVNYAIEDLVKGYDLVTAQKSDLDLFGNAYNVLRRPGESDYNYRIRILNGLTKLKNTKQAVINAALPYCTHEPIVVEWSGDYKTFFLDWSNLDWTDALGGDPYTFEIWVSPIDDSPETYRNIVDAVLEAKPAGTVAYVIVMGEGDYYGAGWYGDFYYVGVA